MLGLSFEVVISLAPISASSTDLKRNQTPHSLFRSFRADNPFQLVDQETEFNLESKLKQVLAPVNHLAITPEGCSRRHSKVLTAKSLAKLLGQLSSTLWLVTRLNKGCYQVCSSHCWPQHACFRQQVLPLLW